MSVFYQREEIKEKVFVPAIVESELRTNIESQLDKCGIFYRVFSRRKSAASLEHKFATGKYGGDDDKKIQDLVGIRINLYFMDDLDICKHMFEDLFTLAEDSWSASDLQNDSFSASKINGVFKLPDYLIQKISPETWEMHIDQTFEIQLKTVFFEGWHEVEHDLRYKMKVKDENGERSIWDDYQSYARQLNSVVATLELCDQSMITLFENFAHQLYKNKDWGMMIRMHYRVRISEQPLYDGLYEILAANESELGKKLFKANRKLLIERLISISRHVPISVNMIIALLNKEVLGNNPDINKIMMQNDVYNDGIRLTQKGYQRMELTPLQSNTVFKNTVFVRGKYENLTTDKIFEKLSDCLYHWTRIKFRQVFPNMEGECHEFIESQVGYAVSFKPDFDNHRLSMRASHIAQDVGGRVWNTEVELYPDDNRDGIWMQIRNTMHDREAVSQKECISRFSYPNFYTTIYNDESLIIEDQKPYGNKAFLIKDERNVNDIVDLIQNQNKQTPVIIIASTEKEDGYLDEEWLGSNWVSSLFWQVKYYTHIYRCNLDNMTSVLLQLGMDLTGERGVYAFWPQKDYLGEERYRIYDEETIHNCVYSKFKGEGAGIREDKVKDGTVAFRFMLIDEIKKCNIS